MHVEGGADHQGLAQRSPTRACPLGPQPVPGAFFQGMVPQTRPGLNGQRPRFVHQGLALEGQGICANSSQEAGLGAGPCHGAQLLPTPWLQLQSHQGPQPQEWAECLAPGFPAAARCPGASKRLWGSAHHGLVGSRCKRRHLHQRPAKPAWSHCKRPQRVAVGRRPTGHSGVQSRLPAHCRHALAEQGPGKINSDERVTYIKRENTSHIYAIVCTDHVYTHPTPPSSASSLSLTLLRILLISLPPPHPPYLIFIRVWTLPQSCTRDNPGASPNQSPMAHASAQGQTLQTGMGRITCPE